MVAYKRLTKGKGPAYRERQRMQVQCPECGVEVAVGSLLMHFQIHHIVGRGNQGRVTPPPSQGGPDQPIILTGNVVETPVPGSGVPGSRVPGWGVKPVQPSGSLCVSPCAGNNFDTGRG